MYGINGIPLALKKREKEIEIDQWKMLSRHGNRNREADTATDRLTKWKRSDWLCKIH